MLVQFKDYTTSYKLKKKKGLGIEMGRVYPYSPSDSGKTLEEPSVIHPFQASLALRIKKNNPSTAKVRVFFSKGWDGIHNQNRKKERNFLPGLTMWKLTELSKKKKK